MYRITTLYIFLFSCILLGCQSEDIPDPLPVSESVVLAETESVTSHEGSVTIQFQRVLSNSVCPQHVTCNWEGALDAEFSLKIDDADPVLFSLEGAYHGTDLINVEIDGYRVEWMGLILIDNGIPNDNEEFEVKLDVIKI